MHPAALRRALADIIAGEKSYDLPTICSAVGLAAGSDQEAFQSKFRYAKKRLDEVPSDELFDLAARLNTLIESEDLTKLLDRGAVSSPIDEVAIKSIGDLGMEVISKRWESALERRNNDAEGAITLARTLLEDVCKVIIVDCGDSYSESDDLPKLYKRTAALLSLAPDQHTEQVFKQILGSCQSIVDSLGAIRNKLGDAHSVGPLRVRPSPRHASLAVNLAGAMATFLADTWKAKSK